MQDENLNNSSEKTENSASASSAQTAQVMEEDDFSFVPKEDIFTDTSNNEEKSQEEPQEDSTADNTDSSSKEDISDSELFKEQPEDEEQKKEKKPLNIKKLFIAMGIIIGICAAFYFGGALYYNTHFFFGTTMQGYDCSNMTVEQAEQAISDNIDNFEYTLYERDGKTETIKGNQIELTLAAMGNLSEAKSMQKPLLWLTDTENRKLPLDISLSMNEEKLIDVVANLECVKESNENMAGAAGAVIYQSDNTYAIPDDGKNIVSTQQLFNSIKYGIYGMYSNMNLDTEGCYVDKTNEDTMKMGIGTLNQYVATKITYTKGDQVTVVDGTTINNWITLNDDGSVTLDKSKVKSFVSNLATIYNTAGNSRSFTTSYGNTVTVSGGDYGWKLDVDGETDALCELIKNGAQEDREPEFKQRGGQIGASDIGSTYVEVNIAAQHLWFYKGGQLIVSTDFVSGNIAKGTGTHTGVFSLKYKAKDAVLKGQGYASPVGYWMPFNGGEGMHDATWRSSFGGSIYKTNGSHGCVNLPVSAAASIFSNIDAGTPIVVF